MKIRSQYSYEEKRRILTRIQAYHQIVGKSPTTITNSMKGV